MKPILLVLLLSLLSLSFSLSPPHQDPSVTLLALIPNATPAFMDKSVRQGLRVLGLYGDSLFVVVPSPLLMDFSSRFEDALYLTPASLSSLLVVEGDSPSAGWSQVAIDVSNQPPFKVIYEGKGFLIVDLTDRELLEEFMGKVSLPRDAEISLLPLKPITAPRIRSQIILQQRLHSLKFRSGVQKLVEAVTEKDLQTFALFLTGEDPASNFVTRHSLSGDAVRSGEWAVSVFQQYGFNATLESFRVGYCPNVIAERKGTQNPDEIVIIGAHLDCRNVAISDSTGRAPGANDDGSGSAAILQIAKAIFDTGVTFKSTVKLALWCGEEQGLYGSRDHAARAANERQDILGMFQADMIGYQAYANPQCAFVDRYTDPTLTSFARSVGSIYVPEITQVTTSACCSDHQGFYEEGYPSVGLVEGGGYIIDPKYHNVGDTVERSGYSLNQMQSITRVMISSMAELALVNE